MALHRPSELARIWELHPKTVYLWIREGRLPAIKTPGAQYRVRTDDARAYCQKNNLPMPRSIATPAGVVAAIGKPGPTMRAVAKACAGRGAAFVQHGTALEGLLAIAGDPPDVLLLDARAPGAGEGIKLEGAIRALKRTEATADVAIVVIEGSPKGSPLLRLGASAVAARGDADEAVRVVLELLEATRGPAPRRGRG